MSELAAILSYGMLENLDVVLGVPYRRFVDKEDGVTVVQEEGISDMSVEMKWRFYDSAGTSLAFKPGVSAPTGNDRRGLGAGKYGFTSFLIGTHEAKPWTIHVNLGYLRNDNRIGEAKNLWHASCAVEWNGRETVRVVGNIGIEKNPDKLCHNNPSFALAGIIYAVSEELDLNLGFKAGLSRSETDQIAIAGFAWRF